MKHEWRKKEKQFYLPKETPEKIYIPEFNFFTISGQGNPNSTNFSDHIAALYAVSYGVKMSLKKNPILKEYTDYTVYPLEGVWDISAEAKQHFNSNVGIDKNELVYKIMIRQPSFITLEYASEIMEQVKAKKPNLNIERTSFEKITEGDCIQMLHVGPFENEPQSFAVMEEFASNLGFKRISKKHKEIYLSDFRKVPKEKLKTVLRFKLS
ncbi:GyrI-like domain-containing protein [Flavobacteriaceae bacterium S356]|uniref:GyrI-like domain-containing protein n=1 Tax=Asprobacillus argus TaxID=3076534 RepID=A0ABU3LGJ7_9FLAO|nr:GyrI-like domain-containing protein [Flavobacteriaceae bacterium S356]